MVGISVVNIKAQSPRNTTDFYGCWITCGSKYINLNEIKTFLKKDSVCQNQAKGCLTLKWIVKKTGDFNSGWKTGCGVTKVGYDLKRVFNWRFDVSDSLLVITHLNTDEVYKVLGLNETKLIVSRIK